MKKLKLVFLCVGATLLFGCTGNSNNTSTSSVIEKEGRVRAPNKTAARTDIETNSTTVNVT